MIDCIKYRGRELKNNFSIGEFRYIEPHPDLLGMLNLVREELRHPIYTVNGGGTARSIQEHVIIYQNLFGRDWLKNIPWNSRHLPKHGIPKARAADIYSPYCTFEQLKDIIYKVQPSDLNIGLGIGKTKLHLDIDRPNGDREWYYA